MKIHIEDLTDVTQAVQDTDKDDEGDEDDLYIMVRCVSVCMLRKGTTFIQKILSFLLFIASFRTQRNWSFPCFLTLL